MVPSKQIFLFDVSVEENIDIGLVKVHQYDNKRGS